MCVQTFARSMCPVGPKYELSVGIRSLTQTTRYQIRLKSSTSYCANLRFFLPCFEVFCTPYGKSSGSHSPQVEAGDSTFRKPKLSGRTKRFICPLHAVHTWLLLGQALFILTCTCGCRSTRLQKAPTLNLHSLPHSRPRRHPRQTYCAPCPAQRCARRRRRQSRCAPGTRSWDPTT